VALLDLNKRYGALYKPGAGAPALVEVPPIRFLMLDGEGGVGGEEFQAAMQALYGLAYPVKFAAKKQLDLAYPVLPAEGLYWGGEHDGAPGITPAQLATLSWRLMISLPDEVPGELVDLTRDKVAAKKTLHRLGDIRVQTFSEGPSVQILHIGPYDLETPTAQKLHTFAAEKGYEITGLHHEIYLSDPARTAPDKLRTILRYGVTKPKRQKPARHANSARVRPDSCSACAPRRAKKSR
jgi:hypothetical protein